MKHTILVCKGLIFSIFMVVFLNGCSAPESGSNVSSDARDWPSMKLCVDDALVKIKSEVVTIDLLSQATQLCYTHLHGQGLLNDFRIRRFKFTQQGYDERVLLWMVVVITLSGIALAGVQMLASFKLAVGGKGEFGQAGEFSVEQGRLSLKSSVTGLFIMIFSFAFFWVFVYEIFVMKEFNPDKKMNDQGAAVGVQLGQFVGAESTGEPHGQKQEK